MTVVASAVAPAHAQPTRHGPGVGESVRYSLSIEAIVRDDPDADAEVGALVQTAHVTLEGVSLTEDGSLVALGRFDHVASVWRRDGERFEFSWSRDDAPQPEPDPIPAAPAPADLAVDQSPAATYRRVLTAMAQEPFRVIVNRAGGVVSVRGLTAPDRASASGSLDPATLGMFSADRLAGMLEPIFDAGGMPTPRLQPWTRTRREPIAGAGVVEIVTAWIPTRRDDGGVAATGSITVRPIHPDSPAPAQPTITITLARGSGELAWSAQTGLERWTERVSLGARLAIRNLSAEIMVQSDRTVRRLED